VEIHAYALMGNHYHLLIRTPEANASAAIQWLNVSYSVWFNKRRERVGHVFQGRFGSVTPRFRWGSGQGNTMIEPSDAMR
jgi:putative transposase